MNQVSSKCKLIVTIASAIGALWLYPAYAEADDRCRSLQLQPIHAISLGDIGRLADRKVIAAGQANIVFWNFDQEDHPTRPGWYAIGLIYATSGDLGAEPVGGLLWVKRDSRELKRFSDVSNNSTASAKFVYATRGTCKPTELVFSMLSNGNVYTDGVRTGTVK